MLCFRLLFFFELFLRTIVVSFSFFFYLFREGLFCPTFLPPNERKTEIIYFIPSPPPGNFIFKVYPPARMAATKFPGTWIRSSSSSSSSSSFDISFTARIASANRLRCPYSCTRSSLDNRPRNTEAASSPGCRALSRAFRLPRVEALQRRDKDKRGACKAVASVLVA